MAQEGSEIRGEWVKFEDVAAQNSTSNNTESDAIALIKKLYRMSSKNGYSGQITIRGIDYSTHRRMEKIAQRTHIS